ncbi:MAG: phage terminase large subunit family protein, partial [Leptospiraceae bacterium]|nr:phage terminase large subunit family protein [Leptospiraceae bacterium]
TFPLARLFWKLIRSNYKAGIYFPTDQAMRDFAQERVYPFIDNCPIVKQELTQSSIDNIRVKQFGNAYLILRGTWKKSNVKSVDLDIVMLDEVDEHNKENIEFVGDRLLASKLNWMMLGSQPSMHNTGIHAEFLTTDQHYWLIKCSKCNYWNNLVESIQQDFESIWLLKDENVYYKCQKCGSKLNNQKGEYVAKTKSDKRGYQISQLFTNLDPKIIYRKYKDANTSAKRKNFWISYIGLPYETDEERPITLDEIKKHEADFGLKDHSDTYTFHGADQGDVVHAVFGEPAGNGKIRIIGIYKD